MSTHQKMAALFIAGLLGCGSAGADPMYSAENSKAPPPPPPAAQPDDYGATISNKLGSSLSNIALGWIEIPKNVVNTFNQSNFLFGVVGGSVKGVLHTGGRVLTGVFDLITLPVPTQPIAKPNYVWENMNTETRYGLAMDPKPVGPER